MRLPILLAALCVAAACTPSAQVSKSSPEVGVGFGAATYGFAGQGGVASSQARDFMDLALSLESGRELAVFTRFEGPITVGLSGPAPASAERDLAALVARLRTEAGLDIALGAGNARVIVEFAPRADLRRLAPQAACFVVPNVGSLAEYRRLRGSAAVDWSQITTRDRAAIFIPTDTSPQEIRDCLHEELAQALGPLNDLYRLSDSIFNDDNFHSVLTAYDMGILRSHYDPALASGMTRAEVAARLPAIFGGGTAGLGLPPDATLEDWTQAIETALGRKGSAVARRQAADRALGLARAAGWQDSRAAFSHFAVGRLNAGSNPEIAFDAFARAAAIYARLPGGDIHVAHVDMQLAAMALAGGLSNEAIRLADRAIPIVRAHDNSALLATLMLIKAEAMERLGDVQGAKALRLDTAAYARYGFGPDSVVRDRMRDIATVASRATSG